MPDHGRRRTAVVAATVAVGVLFAFAGLALAGPTEDAARDASKRGTASYNLGQYDEAAADYERAYKLVQDPAVLFNVAQAYRLAGRSEKALTAYRAYLRTAPVDAPNRAQVEARVRELEKIVADTRSTQAAPPAGPLPAAQPPAYMPSAAASPTAALALAPAPTEPSPPFYRRWWFWTAVGAVAVASVVGIVLATRDTSNPDCSGISPCGTLR